MGIDTDTDSSRSRSLNGSEELDLSLSSDQETIETKDNKPQRRGTQLSALSRDTGEAGAELCPSSSAIKTQRSGAAMARRVKRKAPPLPRTKKHKRKTTEVTGLLVLVTDKSLQQTWWCLINNDAKNTIWIIQNSETSYYAVKVKATDYSIVADGKIYGSLSRRETLIMNRDQDLLKCRFIREATWRVDGKGNNQILTSVSIKAPPSHLSSGTKYKLKGSVASTVDLPTEEFNLELDTELAKDHIKAQPTGPPTTKSNNSGEWFPQFSEYDQWVGSHHGKRPRLHPAGDSSQCKLSKEEEKEIKLATWGKDLSMQIEVVGGEAIYRAQWRRRAACLDKASWWEWPENSPQLENYHQCLNDYDSQDGESESEAAAKKWFSQNTTAKDVGWKVSLTLLREITSELSGISTNTIYEFIRRLNSTNSEKVEQMAGLENVKMLRSGGCEVGTLRNFVVGTAFEVLRKMTHELRGRHADGVCLQPFVVKNCLGEDVELENVKAYISEAPAWTGMGLQIPIFEECGLNDVIKRHMLHDEMIDVLIVGTIKGSKEIVLIAEQCKHRGKVNSNIDASKFLARGQALQALLRNEYNVRLILLWTATTASLPSQFREKTLERKEEWASMKRRGDLNGMKLDSLDMEYSTGGLMKHIHDRLNHRLNKCEDVLHVQSRKQQLDPIEPSQFQIRMREKVGEVFRAGNKCMTAVKPTGTGKTLGASFCLHHLENECPEKFKLRPSLVVDPRIRLAEMFHNTMMLHEQSVFPERKQLKYYLYCNDIADKEDVSCNYTIHTIRSRKQLIEKIVEAVQHPEAASYRFFTTYQSGNSFYLAARAAAIQLHRPVEDLFGLIVRDEAHLATGEEFKPYCSILRLKGAFNLSLTATPRFFNIRQRDFHWTPSSKEYSDIFPQPKSLVPPSEQGRDGGNSCDNDGEDADNLPGEPSIASLLQGGTWDILVSNDNFVINIAMALGLDSPGAGATPCSSIWSSLKAASKSLGIGLVAVELCFSEEEGVQLKYDEGGNPIIRHNNRNGRPSSSLENVYVVGVLLNENESSGEIYIENLSETDGDTAKASKEKRTFHCMSGRDDIMSGHGSIDFYVSIPEAQEAKRIVDLRMCMLDIGAMALDWYSDQPHKEWIQCSLALPGSSETITFVATAHEIAAMKGLLDCLAGRPFAPDERILREEDSLDDVDNKITTPIIGESRRCLVFCRSVASARRYLAVLQWLLKREDCPLNQELKDELYTSLVFSSCVDGTSMSYQTQTERLTKFRASNIGVMFNCELLGIGYDLPGIDSVMFADPCQSTEKFLQGVGRALRWDQALADSKIATVIIPCFDPLTYQSDKQKSPHESDRSEEEDLVMGQPFHTKYDLQKRVLECMTKPGLKVLGQVTDLVGSAFRSASIVTRRVIGVQDPNLFFNPEEMSEFLNNIKAIGYTLDKDTNFHEKVERYNQWFENKGKPYYSKKLDLTNEEREERRLAKWHYELPPCIAKVGGQAKYRETFPSRAQALDDSTWFTWPDESTDAETEFVKKSETYTEWFTSHGRRPLTDPRKKKQTGLPLTEDEKLEKELAKWRAKFQTWINRHGEAEFREKRPHRAAALDVAPWWKWPDNHQVQYGKDSSFFKKLEAYDAWLETHDGNCPCNEKDNGSSLPDDDAGSSDSDAGSSDSDDAIVEYSEHQLAEWRNVILYNSILTSGGEVGYRKKYSARAAALDERSWFNWDISKDFDIAFLTTLKEFSDWIDTYKRHPQDRPPTAFDGKKQIKENLTAEEIIEQQLGRWINTLRSSLRSCKGEVGYRKKYPRRATALDETKWFTWLPKQCAAFLVNIQSYTSFLKEHKREPNQNLKPSNPLTEEEMAEKSLGKWRFKFEWDMKKAGVANFKAKYPERTGALDKAEWFTWPDE